MHTDGEGNGSSDQSVFYAQPGIPHSLQPSSTSQTENVELESEGRVQVSFMNSKAF
jgi:hypothetical protein